MKGIEGVSVIICSYNGAWIIPQCLKALAAQQVKPDVKWEILLVDNNSTDRLAEVTGETWRRLNTKVPLRILKELRSGKGYALETGFDMAIYEYLIICDDDNLLNTTYVQTVHDRLRGDRSIGALGGESIPVFETSPPDWIWDFKENYILGAPSSRPGDVTADRDYLWGAGLALRKSTWDYLRENGFEFLLFKGKGKLAGEDPELCFMIKELGFRFFYDDRLSFNHFIRKERLKLDYCKDLYEIAGKAIVYLEIYYQLGRIRSEDGTKRINITFNYLCLLLHFSFNMILHFGSPLKHLRNWNGRKIRWKLEQIRYRATVKELVTLMPKYEIIYKKILSHVDIPKLYEY